MSDVTEIARLWGSVDTTPTSSLRVKTGLFRHYRWGALRAARAPRCCQSSDRHREREFAGCRASPISVSASACAVQRRNAFRRSMAAAMQASGRLDGPAGQIEQQPLPGDDPHLGAIPRSARSSRPFMMPQTRWSRMTSNGRHGTQMLCWARSPCGAALENPTLSHRNRNLVEW